MKSDIEIAKSIKPRKITEIAEKIGIDEENVIPYGYDKAKIPFTLIDESKVQNANLILVTAISPTKAGIGKTTSSVGLTEALNLLGKKTVVALREPSLGPVFGMKGGATGGGFSQVIPMDDINLHFTGDFHAITSANNTLAALLDSFRKFTLGTGKTIKKILWKRVLDVNDRALREVITGLGAPVNGVVNETGFDITPASELMAILCLSNDMEDLRNRVNNILLAYTHDNEPLYVKDLEVTGAIMALLKDAMNPNLVQTLEGNPAIIHGGPFANIAHGCNSIIATKMAMTHGDYVITEAGFGADLGAEKFFNIKCRTANLNPKAVVLVMTSQALKLHGGLDEKLVKKPNLEALEKGLKNAERHIENLQNFGQSVIIAFNKYGFDTDEEINFIKEWCEKRGASFAVNDAFMKGGEGALDLAKIVVDTIENSPSKSVKFTYDLEESLEEKIEKVVKQVYRGKSVVFSANAKKMMRKVKKMNLENLPICIAKTQYSFSANPKETGSVEDFDFPVNDIVINSGAGFIVVVAGNIMRMPGLPKTPNALKINVTDNEIVGLS